MKSCYDINECIEETDECSKDAICLNNQGSYDCQCNAGYEGNGKTCDDVDECESTDSCSVNADCINSLGSYSCSCKTGYLGDGRSGDNSDFIIKKY